MSKGSLFWGNARGRLGQSVFYRAGGEQRNRTYVAKIKNPRTRAQMKNRLSMSNFSNIFRAYQSVLKESFVGRPVKESGFNAFMKANKNSSSAIILPEAKDAGLGVPLNMVVSQGTITKFGKLGNYKVQLALDEDQTSYIGFRFDGWNANQPDLVRNAILAILDGGSYKVIKDQTQLNYLFQALGLPTDAVISILWAEYADEGFRMGVNHYSLSGIQVTNEEFPLAVMSNMSLNIGVGVHMEDWATDEMQCGIVISYKVNGKLDCTSARIISVKESKKFSEPFMPGGELYDEVLSAYSTGSSLVGSGSYISVPESPEQEEE